MADLPPLLDTNNPHVRRLMVQNVINIYRHSSRQARQRGAEWFDVAGDAISKQIKGRNLTHLQGSGLVAAVSPNMEWETHNSNAMKELTSIKGRQWKDIAAGDRSPVQGMSISRANTYDLLKAHHILQGGDPDEVMSRNGQLKQNSFTHNLNQHEHWAARNPDLPTPVTVDGRIHDEVENVMRPWNAPRKITGRTRPELTRGEHFMEAIRTATPIISEMEGKELQPHQVQGMIWTGGQEMERSGVTAKGQARKVGVRRVGQPYL